MKNNTERAEQEASKGWTIEEPEWTEAELEEALQELMRE